MISLDGVTCDYAQCRPLEGVNLDLPTGSTAIMGPSGSGKSTLLRIIAGLQSPTAGVVLIDGSAVRVATWRKAGDPRIAMIYQDYRLVPFLTVEENLRLAGEVREREVGDADVGLALERVMLDATFKRRMPPTLSGGEQQRVSIARALVTGATVLAADEPTGALDSDNTRRITEVLAAVGQEGMTVVVATHDPSVAAGMDQTLLLPLAPVEQVLVP